MNPATVSWDSRKRQMRSLARVPAPARRARRLSTTAALVVATTTLTLAASTLPAQESFPADPGMRDAARALLSSSEGERRHWALSGFEDDERFNWAYTPVPRQGFPLREMTDQEREITWNLVSSGLGERGLQQARDVIRLEEVLYERSDNSDFRDPDMYLITVFGAPGSLGRWGWRFEGHHLSVNFTLLDGQVIGTTPAFFGGNPGYVGEGLHAGLRPFAQEEDGARLLLQNLDPAAQRTAVFSPTAPGDILTTNSKVAERPAALGVRYEQLPEPQQRALWELLELYAARLEPSLAEAELAEIRAHGIDELRFAWAGGLNAGEPHYYRIHGPTFVVEYDNTQNDANHVHTVWRNFERDFGRDPLRQHLATAHDAGAHGHSHSPR